MNALEPLIRLLPPTLRSLLCPPRIGSEQLQRLAQILGVDATELASMRMGARYHYRPFSVAKADGRPRRLLAPSPALKKLQRRFLDEYLAQLPVHHCATAFRSGFSIVDNARRHARQTVFATVDLRDFFESTSARRVRAFFIKQGWRSDALRTLMWLCVYRNGLPQGAPTNPCLSNLVNLPLDEKLFQIAQKSGALYTRYGDDLTFSWNSEHLPGGFQRAVEDRVEAAGYETQPCKGWRVSHISERPSVTGLVLTGNGRVSVPRSWKWRMWVWRWKSWWSADEVTRAKVRGYQGLLRITK
ncbi:MAG: RNA-directed DNA polymerase [Planctomycetes bacterium]|nr:RNA-directed DNA polymerase [Planctomycetota bacterium]